MLRLELEIFFKLFKFLLYVYEFLGPLNMALGLAVNSWVQAIFLP